MLKRLGFTKLAYDWRAEHIASFEDEIQALQREGITFFAHWTPARQSPGYREMLQLIEQYQLHPQLWRIAPAAEAATRQERVEFSARALLPYVEDAKRLGCAFGIYNHGGWAGEPQNMVALVQWLREHAETEDVGIVYNFHHGHEHLARFPAAFTQMLPYLLCVNLNGMTAAGPKILPLGQGQEDRQLLEMIRQSGYQGPIGLLDHREDVDAERSLRENLDGLQLLLMDQRPLDVGVTDAFPEIRIPRPVVVTHAGDGSHRLFVGEQFGKIHVFPAREDVTETTLFLDLSKQVTYKEVENEEGLLGLAFHPRYQQNGYFYVYYTTRDAPHVSVISRFRVSPHDPQRADPQSELEVMRIEQTSWNHNGGTLLFGPDGYLYIGLGDGGGRFDPLGHGQNLSTLHGSILRIDVDHNQDGRPYAIPPDNPFVDRAEACPEIWAYGLRNVWRMAFDRQTGLLWAADNGEDLWEEIDLIERGGNYGWNLREGKHRFGLQGSELRADLIEPIWEYEHDPELSNSIIGGCVYRGQRVPQLRGAYLYGDYVVGSLWALWYDPATRRVTANRAIQGTGLPIMTYGEDEQGEVYVTTMLGGGVIYRFAPRQVAPQPAPQ